MSKHQRSELMSFAMIALLVLRLPLVIADVKPPSLEYGIISRNNKAPPSTTHPPPVNDHPTRGCHAENFCRGFTLSIQSRSAVVEAVGKVEMGAPLNKSREVATEAIASGIGEWTLNKTNGNGYGRLSVSGDPTYSAELLAFSRGITSKGLKIDYSFASTEDATSLPLPPVDGKVIITVDAAANQVRFMFLTQLESLGETDIDGILEHAKEKLLAILKLQRRG